MILDYEDFIFGIIQLVVGCGFLLSFRLYVKSWKSECKKAAKGEQIDSNSYFNHLLWGWSSLMGMGALFFSGLFFIYLSMCEPL